MTGCLSALLKLQMSECTTKTANVAPTRTAPAFFVAATQLYKSPCNLFYYAASTDSPALNLNNKKCIPDNCGLIRQSQHRHRDNNAEE